MIASDIRVIKRIIQRVRIDLYKARYDRVLMLIESTAPPHTVYTHTPGRLTRRRPTGCGVAVVSCFVLLESDLFYGALDHSNTTGYHTGAESMLRFSQCTHKPATPSHLSKIAPKHIKNGCLQSQSMHCRSRPPQPLSARTRVSRDPGVRARSQPRHIPPSTPRFRAL